MPLEKGNLSILLNFIYNKYKNAESILIRNNYGGKTNDGKERIVHINVQAQVRPRT